MGGARERSLRLSVGIPAYNEEANIGRLLKALLNQELPRWLKLEEIVVVASGCTDRTEDIVRSFEEQDERVKLVVELAYAYGGLHEAPRQVYSYIPMVVYFDQIINTQFQV